MTRIPRVKSTLRQCPPEAAAAVEEWVCLFVEAPTWQARSAQVDGVLQVAAAADDPAAAHSAMYLLTAGLERLNEGLIANIEQAVAYRFSCHRAWQIAAAEWMQGLDAEDLADFADTHPGFARMMTTLVRLAAPATS